MQYDDASWHSGTDLADDLPAEAGATHIGMFVAWALLSGLGGSLYDGSGNRTYGGDRSHDLRKLRMRLITPRTFFLDVCKGKFAAKDLNEKGKAFALVYYAGKKARYLSDYGATLGKSGTTIYHVADTWENFDRLKPVLDRQF